MTRATVTALAVVALISASFVVFAPGTTRSAQEQVIRVTAKKFEYSPNEITVKKGVPVILEITSLDRDHGFKLEAFNINQKLKKGETETIEFTADKTGTFPFQCSEFCGLGHGKMKGKLVVGE